MCSRGPRNESTTRGSRSMLRSLRWWLMCPLTISSPSSPIQITVTCGDPSALIVLRCASGPLLDQLPHLARQSLIRALYSVRSGRPEEDEARGREGAGRGASGSTVTSRSVDGRVAAVGVGSAGRVEARRAGPRRPAGERLRGRRLLGAGRGRLRAGRGGAAGRRGDRVPADVGHRRDGGDGRLARIDHRCGRRRGYAGRCDDFGRIRPDASSASIWRGRSSPASGPGRTTARRSAIPTSGGLERLLAGGTVYADDAGPGAAGGTRRW